MHCYQKRVNDSSTYTVLSRRTSSLSVAYGGGRRELINELSSGIDADEAGARILFQAFDVDSQRELETPETQVPQTPFRPLTNVQVLTQPRARTKPDTENIPPRQSHPNSNATVTENPFLQTPLRAKYFPKLSPTILRQLLRSPSPNVYTPDESFEAGNDSVVSASASFPSISSMSSAELLSVPSLPASSSSSSSTKNEMTSTSDVAYPLTPPQTGRIPSLGLQESPAYTLDEPDVLVTPGSRINGVDTQSVPDLRACLSSMSTASHLHNFRSPKRPKLRSDLATTPVTSRGSAGIPVTRSFGLLSSAARRSYCVADEIHAGGGNPDERRLFLMSLLRDTSFVEPTFPVLATPHRFCTGQASPSPLTPSSPSIRPRQTAHVSSNDRVRKSGRILEREYADLLGHRAEEEEKHARELREMAERLERLALHRRKLAALMGEEDLSEVK